VVNATLFINEKTSFEQINRNFKNIKPLEEKLKNEIIPYLNNAQITIDLEEQTMKDLRYYTEKELIYFTSDQYVTANLQLLMTAINIIPYFLHKKYFLMKKELLTIMKDIENTKSDSGIISVKDESAIPMESGIEE
jgi:hypothetical protein